ncbi:MAG TPA: N-acetyltransferase family protein [Candidatus Paceibacterota bacterium]|nr:N-acetyltransferase family protein [Verrucomicrobiota bacterium]HRY49216.1 N-acetyltransferase family protein [Candidatus Paceibacterota bacterium]HSA03559.1 N-acetyltransferase family protein [Candidatus Paceibacterota bacterium]
MADDVIIRPACFGDLTEINSIYNYYVAHSTCVWTTQPCSDNERKTWYEEHGQSMPVWVADHHGRVVGWGALGSFRAAYTAAGVLEDSIYVRHDFHRRGIGSRLLQTLIDSARSLGLRSILANISADQTPSIRLHEKFGFQKVAHLRDVGQKFDQRLDAVYMQLLLANNQSAASNPDTVEIAQMAALRIGF